MQVLNRSYLFKRLPLLLVTHPADEASHAVLRLNIGVAVVAEIPLSSPRKLFFFVIKKKFLQDHSIPKIDFFFFEENFSAQNGSEVWKALACLKPEPMQPWFVRVSEEAHPKTVCVRTYYANKTQ